MKCRETLASIVVCVVCVGTLVSVLAPNTLQRALLSKTTASNESHRSDAAIIANASLLETSVMEVEVLDEAGKEGGGGLIVEKYRLKVPPSSDGSDDKKSSPLSWQGNNDHLGLNKIADPVERLRQFQAQCEAQRIPQEFRSPSPSSRRLAAIDVPHLSVPWRNFLCTRGTRLAAIEFIEEGKGASRAEQWKYGRINVPIHQILSSEVVRSMKSTQQKSPAEAEAAREPSTSPLPPFLSEDTSSKENSTGGANVKGKLPAVVLHDSILLFIAPLRSMFHSWFDVSIPAAWMFLRYANGSYFLPNPLSRGGDRGGGGGALPSASMMELVREASIVHLKGLPQSGSSIDGAIKLTTDFLSSGRHVVRNQSETEQDVHRVHCYCGGVLLGNGALSSTGSNKDPAREVATEWAVAQLFAFNNLLPMGTSYPISPKVYGHHGLWLGDGSLATQTSTRQQQILTPSSPRMLIFLRRKTRLIGDVQHIIALAKDIGFNVLAVYPEDLSPEVQLHTSRYADILVAIHGMALTWMLAMDGFSNPYCRRVVELRYFGRKLKGYHNVYETMASNSRLAYEGWSAVDATFDPQKVWNPVAEKAQLRKKAFPHSLPGFMYQTAYYNLGAAKSRFQAHYEALRHCLASPPRPSS